MILPAVVSLLIILFNPHSATTSPSVDTPPGTVNKVIILQLINTARKKGCQCGEIYYSPAAPLSWNDHLEQAALKHTIEMADKNMFSHISVNGADPGSRISASGYNWKAFGENIAMGYRMNRK